MYGQPDLTPVGPLPIKTMGKVFQAGLVVLAVTIVLGVGELWLMIFFLAIVFEIIVPIH